MCGIFYSKKDLTASEQFKQSYQTIFHRGPDNGVLEKFSSAGVFGFHRLSIMDLSSLGNQPFADNGIFLVCNGEIFNHLELRDTLLQDNPSYKFHGHSDCEVLIPLYETVGIEVMVKMLDGEFAFILEDTNKGKLFAARDPMGIRPMFYGYEKESQEIAFASEAKALLDFCNRISPFPPGHYYQDGQFICYHDLANPRVIINDDLPTIFANIKSKLEKAVIKRLSADAEIGYLLSGGLDSSLVCAIAQKHSDKPIRTFAVGMDKDPIDLKYAKEVADYLGTEHTEVIINKEDILSNLEKVIYHLETWDITTIRASMGMYLICKFITENTNIKALLTGEVSDEIFGYKYTDFAPNAAEFQKEAEKRIRELYMYDVLRADRCLAANSLEARVPFSDIDFVTYCMSINPQRKLNTYNKGKYLLRQAFVETDYLPESILMREKAAFSDAVGHSLVDYLKAHAEEKYSADDLIQAQTKYSHGTPFTKESLMYRDIFEKFYPGQSKWIKDFWMPNSQWVGNEIKDPSARVLSNYGDSGK